MAAICLLVGLAGGYLFRGSQTSSAAAPTEQAADVGSNPGVQPMPTLEQMKHMADKSAEPLLAKLKTEPNNAQLLLQIGNIYKSTHQFKEAAGFYERILKLDPKKVAARTEMASCLYYTGDIDGAIRELRQSLKDDPNDANSLFNLGMIKWQSKNDAAGAVAAWQQLLLSNPKLEQNKKAQVQKLIAEARAGIKN